MSYIDSFDHEHVGFFSGIPIYRPLEIYEPENTLDGQFSCNEKNLILGGGYLEHPGMVVRDLDFVAAYFITEWIDYCDETDSSKYEEEVTEKWASKAYEYIYGKDEFEILDCIHWSMRDYSDFYTACKSSAMGAPFKETEQRNAFEPWLAKNFGELVIFSYPELIENEDLLEIAKNVDRYLYGNISVLPAGYPNDFLGRKTSNGKILQGNRAWKIIRNV